MTWLPKSVVCLGYYDRSRFRSDAFAGFLLSLQIFPLAIAVAIAIGVRPLYGISCAAVASLLASIFGDSKIRVCAPNVIFVAVASTIVAREGILGLCFSTFLAGVLLMFFGAIRLGAAIQVLPRPVSLGFTTGIAVLVVSEQLPGLLGLRSQIPAGQLGWGALMLVRHVTPVEPRAVFVAFAALLLMVASRRKLKYAPTGLIVVTVGVLLVRFGHFPARSLEAFYVSRPMFPLYPAGVLRFELLVLKTLAICAVLLAGCLQLNGIPVQAGKQVATIRHIAVTGDHDLDVEITATVPITARTQTVTDPDRLIVDLPESLPGAGLHKIFVNRGKLIDIRVGLLSANPRITRVVLDLASLTQYRVLPMGNTIVVKLSGESGPGPHQLRPQPCRLQKQYRLRPPLWLPFPRRLDPLDPIARAGFCLFLLQRRFSRCSLSP